MSQGHRSRCRRGLCSARLLTRGSSAGSTRPLARCSSWLRQPVCSWLDELSGGAALAPAQDREAVWSCAVSPGAGKRSAVSLPSPPAVTPAKQCNNPCNLSAMGGQHPGTNQLCGHVPKLQVNPRVTCPRTSAAMHGLLGCILAQMTPVWAWGGQFWGSLGPQNLWRARGCGQGSRAGHRARPELATSLGPGLTAHVTCIIKLWVFFSLVWLKPNRKNY